MNISNPVISNSGEHTAKWEALSLPETRKALLAEIVSNVRLLFLAILRNGGRRPRRNRALVEASYDLGTWKPVLEKRAWMEFTEIGYFVNHRSDAIQIAKIDNHLVRVSMRDYFAYNRKCLCKILTEFGDGENEIIELGCGAGMNLFSLLLEGKWNRLWGFDISKNAVQAAMEIATHFDLQGRMFFDQLDLTNGGDPNFGLIRGKTVFTYYCLEQLKYSTKGVIENIIRANPRRVVHIEPTTELLHLWSLKDVANYLYIFRRDYQNNLVRTVRSLEKEGALRVIDVRRLYHAPKITNDATLICWEPESN